MQLSARQLAALGPTSVLSRALVRAPSRVLLTPTVCVDLARDRRRRPLEEPRDRAQRVTAADPEQDLLTITDREASSSGCPGARDALRELALPHHQPDHRRRTPDLSGDIRQPPATRS